MIRTVLFAACIATLITYGANALVPEEDVVNIGFKRSDLTQSYEQEQLIRKERNIIERERVERAMAMDYNQYIQSESGLMNSEPAVAKSKLDSNRPPKSSAYRIPFWKQLAVIAIFIAAGYTIPKFLLSRTNSGSKTIDSNL